MYPPDEANAIYLNEKNIHLVTGGILYHTTH